METNESFNSEQESVLELDDDARYFLHVASKWSYFISILGFIMILIMFSGVLVMGLGVGFLFGNAGPAMAEGAIFSFIWIIYIVMILVYFFPIYYLYKFSTRLKMAMRNDDTFELTESFRFLSKHYKFIGVLAIIMLILYPILFLIGGFASVFTSF
jgi:ABC-type multidrug transport system fused ATPase/permease subunit